MTRQEPLDEVNDCKPLKHFCANNGCNTCEEIFSEEERNGHINEVDLPVDECECESEINIEELKNLLLK